jgi:hypothetical protein
MALQITYEAVKNDGLWYVFEVRNGRRASKPTRGYWVLYQDAQARATELGSARRAR